MNQIDLYTVIITLIFVAGVLCFCKAIKHCKKDKEN